MKYDVPFEDLPEDLQHANRAAARRIPIVLAVASLRIVRPGEVSSGDADLGLSIKEAQGILEAHIEAVAIAEHEGWVQEKLDAGWQLGSERDDVAKTHPSIITYDDLSEEEKEKDRSAVRNYPEMVRRAGLAIVKEPSDS